MMTIYTMVAAWGKPNFIGAHVPLLFNLDVGEWNKIACTEVDPGTVAFLKYGLPTGFEGPIPAPLTGNHRSALQYPRDVATYI